MLLRLTYFWTMVMGQDSNNICYNTYGRVGLGWPENRTPLTSPVDKVKGD